DFRIRKSVHTERFGIVSGETRIFEVPGNMKNEYQLLFLPRFLGSLGWSPDELNGGAIASTGAFRLHGTLSDFPVLPLKSPREPNQTKHAGEKKYALHSSPP